MDSDIETEKHEDKEDWLYLLQTLWFGYCCYTIYQNYYEYDYQFYRACGQLEIQTVLFGIVYLYCKYRPKLNSKLEEWRYLLNKLLEISIAYILIAVLIVKIFIKTKEYYHLFIYSDLYLDISNFIYGLTHPFS